MTVRTKDLSGAARLNAGAAGLNMQHSVRGRAEIVNIEPPADTDRRFGARLTADDRGHSGCICGAWRTDMML